MPDATTPDRDGPAGTDPGVRRRRTFLVVAVVVVVAVVAAVVLPRGDDDKPAAGLTVTWGGSEGDPSCAYNPGDRTVDAKVTIDGEAPEPEDVTVTVTAYADENTSRPVGSSTRTVQVEGTVHLPVVITIAVTRPPHVDEDGIAACGLAEE